VPFPGNLALVAITGAFPLINGDPQDGFVVFDPGQVVTDPDGEAIFSGRVSTPVRASVMTPIQLPATDNASLRYSPPFVYTCTVHVGNTIGVPFQIALPAALGATVDLSYLQPVTPAPPASAFASPNVWTATQIFAASPPFEVPSGAGFGKILTSDSSGNMTLQTVGGATVFSQPFTSQSVVTVTHNLGKFPAVTVLDTAGDECVGDVVQVSMDQLVVSFSAPFSGVVYCN